MFAQVNPSDVKSTTIENPQYKIEQVDTVDKAALPVIEKATVEEVVREYFKDIPILIKVSKCESQFRQYDSKGMILRGIENTGDVGAMQINEHYHLERSQKMGLNIYTLMGNLAYARQLYADQGTAPWLASSPCWAKI